MILTSIDAADVDTQHAAQILRAFLTTKYYMEPIDANTLRHINDDVASFCAWRKDTKPLTAVVAENRSSIVLCIKA